MITPCTIRLLGTLQAERDGRVITRFRTRQTGALLAYLALYWDRAHPRDALVDLLWPEDTLDAGRHKLRLALSSLRQQFESPGVPAGAVLIANRLSVQLNPAAVATDVAEFEAALRAADHSRSRLDRARLLSEAVDRYPGELLPGYFDRWILSERQRLEDTYLHAMERLISLAEEQDDVPGALRWARRAVAADPVREEAHQTLIRLLIAAGQRDAAARQYQELERLLSLELGEEPSERTRRLLREGEDQCSVRRGSRESRRDSASGAPSDDRTGEPASDAAAPSARLPLAGGTVTLLLCEVPPPADASRRALTAALERHDGQLIRSTGGALLAAFSRATDALTAAVAAQSAAVARGLGASQNAPERPSTTGGMEPEAGSAVRMALHSGEIEIDDGSYRGIALDHVVRVLLAAHPGQILCSEATAGLLRSSPEPGKAGCPLDELGVYRLAGTSAEESVPERLFQVRCPGMPPRGFPPPQAPPAHAGHLPVPLTRFFGREEEIRRLRALLAEDAVRLVTLTGPGGSGKTRLALEVARAFGIPFYGAAWFVPLADLSHADALLDAIAGAMQLPRCADQEPMDAIARALSNHPSLLVLDNFEHLIEPGTEIVRSLLVRIPGLTCMITSRQVLDLSGEWEFVVGPLPVPAEGWEWSVKAPATAGRAALSTHNSHLSALSECASVRLFIDRAQAVRPDFQLTVRNARAIAAVCRRVEGIPLAVELAAAWARTVSPAQIVNQLERRLDLLVSRKRDLPSRHRSLRAALDWSYHRLSPELQRLFARLCIFRDGWTLAAAKAVSGHPGRVLHSLDQLVSRSLILADESGGETRYRMLESMREYAAEQLAPEERVVVAARHAQHFLTLAERAEPELSGPEQVCWLDRLEREHENLRAALDWCLAPGVPAFGYPGSESPLPPPTTAGGEAEPSPAETGLRLIAALWWFWTVRGHWNEGDELCRRVVALPDARPCTAVRARALGGAARLVRDPEIVRALLAEALEIHQDLEDLEGMTGPLNTLGHLACSRGDYQEGRALYEQCGAIRRELGNEWGAAMSLANQGKAAYSGGDHRSARSLLQQSLATMRALKDGWHVAYALVTLGLTSCSERRWDEAAAHYHAALRVLKEVDGKSLIIEALEGLALVAEAEGSMARASRLLAAAEALRAAMGAPPMRPEDPGYARYPAHALARRCEAAYPADWAQGQQMPFEQVLAEALATAEGGTPAVCPPAPDQFPS